VLTLGVFNKRNQADPDLFKSSFTKGGILLKCCVKYVWSGFLKTFEKEFTFNPYALCNLFCINSHTQLTLLLI